MKRRVMAGVLAAAMSVTLLAGCGGGASSGGTSGGSSALTQTESTAAAAEAEAPAQESGAKSSAMSKVVVNIWDSKQQKGIQTICDEWTATSGIPVSVEVVDWDNYWTLLEAGASGGEMPDVFWMHSNTAQMYMENDVLLDLTDYINNDDAIVEDNYYEGIWNLYQSSGKQYALPKDHDTIALLYNKAIFDKYGVDYPTDEWSWEDVRDAAAKITEAGAADGIYGYAGNTSNNQDFWYNIVYDYGAEIVTEDHKSTTIGSDQGKAAMEMVRQLLEVSAPQTTVAETGTDSLFKSGLVGMITQGSWMINTFYTSENASDYAWALLPYGDANGNGQCDDGERQSCYNGLGWAAAADVEDPAACYSLISYFCSEAGQKKQAELGVTMGGMEGISDAFASAFEGMDVSAFTRIEEEGKLYFRPYTRKTTVWEDAIQQDAFLPAWQNPADAATMAAGCDKAQQIITDAIAAE